MKMDVEGNVILESLRENYFKDRGGFTKEGARYYGFKKGYIPWNKGKRTGLKPTKGMHHRMESRRKISINNAKYWKGKLFTDEHKRKLSLNHADFSHEKSPRWKGEKVGKVALHQWVAKYKGKPMECSICGDKTKSVYDWANIDHRYKRDLNDYIRLCRSCHRKYDMKHNNYKK